MTDGDLVAILSRINSRLDKLVDIEDRFASTHNLLRSIEFVLVLILFALIYVACKQ